MRNFILIFLILLVYSAGAQIPSWPPGGITPSSMQFLLPSSRIIPSTKRYNLIWADQLYGLPPNLIQFVAKNYVGTQKIFAYQAADYRSINPNFLVISYHLANGINPQRHDDCPDPKNNHGNGFIGVIAPNGFVNEWNDYFLPWLNAHSIVTGSNRFEQMFQHYDSVVSTNRVWHIDPFWAMNLENADWRDYYADNIISWMSGNENEGTFLDVSVETMVSPLYHPNQNDPQPYYFNWYISPHGPAGYSISTLSDFANWMNSQYLLFYQYLYRRFHSAIVDYLVLPNTDQMVTGWYDPVWTDGDANGEAIDGAMMENFGSYTGSDMYLSLERGLRHLTGRGKILIAQFSDTTQHERYRRVAMYMLIKNENSYLCIHPGHTDWYPEFEIDLGDQSPVPVNIDSLRVSGSGSNGLFRRDFSEGMVLCNTSSSTFSQTLSGNNWFVIETNGGGEVDTSGNIAAQNILYIPVSGTVTVGPSECMILKNIPNMGTDNILTEDNFQYYYDINTDHIHVEISSDHQAHSDIYLCDIYGRIRKNIFSGNLQPGQNKFDTSLENLGHGIYFLVIKGSVKKMAKFVK